MALVNASLQVINAITQHDLQWVNDRDAFECTKCKFYITGLDLQRAWLDDDAVRRMPKCSNSHRETSPTPKPEPAPSFQTTHLHLHLQLYTSTHPDGSIHIHVKSVQID